jgi:hypothetical protein
MRIVHAVFVAALAMYAYVAELAAGKNGSGVSDAMLYGIVFAASLDGLIAFYFRRTKLLPALETLRRDPNRSDALKNWRFSTLVSMVLVLSIGLYGFVLRFLGASQRVSWSFYVAALILLLLWRPKLELGADEASMPRNQ